jgi:hypothetical protein
MGLSVAISGGIILTVFVLVLLSLPGLADKMFSIGDISSQVSKSDLKITHTDISLESLFATSGSPYVNFTLNNDDREKLWKFEKFNVIVEYESASGDKLEELSFSGKCLGVLPAVGDWCIEQIAGDFLDKGILNDGESAKVWTRVSQNLVNGNARVSVSTDNGVVSMLPAPKRSWTDLSPIPPAKCEFETYGRTFLDSDTGIQYICDPIRDKWLSETTMSIWGDETGTCNSGQNANSNANCNVDWGNGLGPSTTSGLAVPHNATIIGYGFSQGGTPDCTSGTFDLEVWGSGDLTTDSTTNYIGDLASGLGNVDESSSLTNDLDLDGQYIKWGIDNNCGQNLSGGFIMGIFFKWHHDDP